MINQFVDFIKEKYPKFYLFLLLGISLYLYRYQLISIVHIAIDHYISLIFITTILVVMQHAFKYSDIKSNIEIDSYYQPIEVKSNCNYGVSAYLKESFGLVDGNYKRLLQVTISNESNADIKEIKGFFYLYHRYLTRDDNCFTDKRLMKVAFHIDNLYHHCREVIVAQPVEWKIASWNCFDVYVSSIVSGSGEFIRPFRLYSNQINRTYALALNFKKYYDYKLLGIRTKYNLAWLKRYVQEYVIPRGLSPFMLREDTISMAKSPGKKDILGLFSDL